MSYNGSKRTMAFPIPSTNTGASIYPGALRNNLAVDNEVWVASGVICALHFKSGTALIPRIEIYDFTQEDTGRPAFDTNHYETDAGANVVGLVEGLGADGDALGTPIFECMSAPAAANGANAFVIANCRKVWEFEPSAADTIIVLNDIDAVCVHGMVIQLVGTITADAKLSVTYIPWALGAHRRKIATKIGVGGSFGTEQLPVA